MVYAPGTLVIVADSLFWHRETEATVVLPFNAGDPFVVVTWGGDGVVHAIIPENVRLPEVV